LTGPSPPRYVGKNMQPISKPPAMRALLLTAVVLGMVHSGIEAADQEPQVFNGVPTADYPALAGITIQFSGSLGLCSGTLIAPAVVLTAAHCVENGPLAVTVSFVVSGTQQDHPVRQIEIDPRRVAGRLAADIAVLKLATPVNDVVPIPLARVRPRPGSTGTIVGFGEDASGQIAHREAGTIRVGRCPARLRRAGLSRLGTFVCWRADRGGAGICPGDSGGPLLVGGAVAGVAVATTSPGCGPSRLDVDTSVAAYSGWIDEQLQPDVVAPNTPSLPPPTLPL